MSIKILIIGYGFVGQELGKYLQQIEGYEVHAIKREPIQDSFGASMIYKSLDSLQLSDIPDVDFVFYCASADTRSIDSYTKAYVDNLQHCLDLLSQKKYPIQRCIFTSSTAVYEVSDGSWVREETSVSVQDPHAQILLDGESVLRKATFPTTVIRFSGIYGTDRHPVLDKLMEGNANFCHSTRYSNRIHVVDCARVLEHVMRIDDNEGLYIATDSEPTPINTIISWLSSKTGTPMPEIRQHDAAETEGGRGGNKRCSNARILATGFRLEYQNYHQGFQQILLDKGLIVE